MKRELFHFDIETVSEYPNIQSLKDIDIRGYNLFVNKYEWLWKDKYDSLDEAYKDKAGIISTYGKIICISFGFIKDDSNKTIKSYYGNNEYDIVNSFNNALLKVQDKNFNIAGFKILQFDIPFLLHKLHKYEIKPAEILLPYNKKPWDMRIVDLAEDWKQKTLWPIYLDEVAYELNIDSPKDDISGKDVSRVYWEENDLEKIKNYCEKDVNVTIEIEKKIY
jgi:predicted PolB exonuclease-like 3'-5' exonuclease